MHVHVAHVSTILVFNASDHLQMIDVIISSIMKGIEYYIPVCHEIQITNWGNNLGTLK